MMIEQSCDSNHVAASVAVNIAHANQSPPTHTLLRNPSPEALLLPGQVPAKDLANTATKAQAASKSDSCSPQQHKPVQHLPYSNPLTNNWWTFELAATIVSFASFIALIIILRHYDGQRQTEWSYQYLTLNGLAAILSTITQATLLAPVAAALSQSKWVHLSSTKKGSVDSRRLEDLEIFDQASRGAWGSARLLWVKRGQHLSAIGPSLMILALAFGTFTQQIISIQYRDVHVASMLPNVPTLETLDTDYDEVPFKLDHLMASAISNAFLPVNASDLPIHCPTGNCTWPIIPSLGVCAGCTDLTRNLSRTCDSKSCSYRLPNGVSANSSESVFMVLDYWEIQKSSNGDYFYYTPVIYNNLGSGWQTNYLLKSLMKPGQVNNVPLYFRIFVAIGARWQGLATDDFSATECALWACVQADSVSVHNGYQSQQIVSAWVWTRNPSGPYTLDNIPPGHVTFVDIPHDYNVLPTTNFTVTGAGWQYLLYTLDCFYRQGNISAQGTYSSFPGGNTMALWKASSDWDTWIENLAHSITNALCLGVTAADNTQLEPYYTGQAYSTVAFIKIRWAWIAFPAFLVLASFIFLLITMWQTRQSKIYAWKDSTLALLALGLDAEFAKEMVGSINTQGELDHKFGDKRVYLSNEDGKWKLRLSS